MSSVWSQGDLVVRREELGLQPDVVAERTPTVGVWLETPVFIVEDTPEQLVSYIAPGARFRFPEGPWPTPNGLQSDGPWWDRSWAQWTPPEHWVNPGLPAL